ncbi:hypothetical protein T637_16090 [Enterobacter hormaechei subsp. hoffmannii]|nr:hypothetical protein T637_16090 [Enterobacter hormaechei subsp. hoffmannii]
MRYWETAASTGQRSAPHQPGDSAADIQPDSGGDTPIWCCAGLPGTWNAQQPAESGFQRLFVRKLVGVFERLWPCSFQPPTLRDVASWLTEHSGLTFSVPDADYLDRPIPHFTHSGTGYQLQDNLGKTFGIQR